MLFHTYQYNFASQGILVDSAPHTCIISSAKSLWGAVWTENLWLAKMSFMIEFSSFVDLIFKHILN